jgi:hypothetical protein
MSLTPLNFNSNGAPEPAEDNTITLREYTGGPIAQFDAEQNFINFKGRVNDLLNSVSNLTSTVSSNQSSLQTEISNLSTTLTNSINSSNAAQDATIASNLSSLTTSLTDQITALQNADNNLNTSDATFGDTVNGVPSIKIDTDNGTSIRGPIRSRDTDGSYESLTASTLSIVDHPDGGANSGSSLIFNGEKLATPENKLIIDPFPGRVVELRRGAEVDGDLNVTGSITVSGEVNPDRAGWNFITPVEVVPHYFGGTSTQRHKVFGVGGVPSNATRALLQWQTHQGYVQIRNPNGHGHITVGNIGDNQDGSAVFVVENIQLVLNQNVGPSTSSLSVPTSKTHSNMIPEGHIEFVLGDANHDGPSRHLFIKAIAYMI